MANLSDRQPKTAKTKLSEYLGSDSALDALSYLREKINPIRATEFEKAYYGTFVTDCESPRLTHLRGEWKLDEESNDLTTKGETTMSNLRTVNLTLIDNDANLKAAEKIVFQCLGLVTEQNDDRTIQQVLITGDVANALDKHNKKRSEVVDDSILRATGRDVKLKPVEIYELKWQVVQVG